MNDTDEKIDEVQESIEQDAEQVESAEQFNVWEDKYKRALADYQNLQRRTQEQKSEWIKAANRDLILKILPVLDTLMLAAKHVDDKGLQLSIDQFLKLLETEGVTRIKTIGEEFNPHTMECVTTQPGEEGKVLEELRAGFMLYDVILRSAQVIVGKAN